MSTLAPSEGLTGLPTVTPPGHSEQAMPPWLPMSTVREPLTILPPDTLSVIRAAGLPLIRFLP
ncbi:hypothetical protein EJO68_35200 [Variovorax atrisoli]|nr:hypothetical protein EJO68_35200 [Variovorax sp. 369]